MKSIRWWRVLGLGLLALLLLAVGAGWWVLTRYAEPFAQREIRRGLTQESELLLAPFEVKLSLLRDFPYPTATLRHLALTDTAHGRAVPVMKLDELDLRLDARELLHRRARVTRLVVRGLLINQEVDSLGRHWGLRGNRQPKPSGHAPAIDLAADSIILYDFRMATRNDFIHSALAAGARQARLSASIRRGALVVRGHFTGELEVLRNRSGTLLSHEPVSGRVHYRYQFEQRRGYFFDDTRAALHGDTISMSGTHQADTVRVNGLPRGNWLNLRFAGTQPLVEVLHAALPPTIKPYLRGAVSPSKAQLVYTIAGLSGPKVRPRTIMRFGLRGASIQWPDSNRRIDHWDLQATFDNGPSHSPRTMSLTFERCRIYSPVGELDVNFVLRDFRRPRVQGRLHGRTELAALAVLLPSHRWHPTAGIADLNVQLRGLLPAVGKHRGEFRKNMSVIGTADLHDAAFTLAHRRTGLRHVNVHIGLRDSLWKLTNASGELGEGMRFRATATTVRLLDYATDQSEHASIAGSFELNQLDLAQLRELTRRQAPPSARQLRRSARARQQLTATLGRSLIPAGLHLDVALRLKQLALATDTLRELAVRLRHDGRRVQLSGIRGRLWSGQVSGQAQWPTDSANAVVPVTYDLAFRFDTLNYRRLAARLSRPPRHSVRRPTSPAIRELLLAANGHMRYDIGALALPDGEALREVHLRIDKDGSALNLKSLRFDAPQGGHGEGSALVLLDGLHIVAADATLDLRYKDLDVPRLLRMLASVAPPPADSAARAVRTAQRQVRAARRAARNGGQAPESMLTNGQFTALLRVSAEQVRYAAVQGTRFRLTSRLRQGEALLDECSVNTLDGRVTLHGRLVTNGGRAHHPLEVQASLEDIALPQLFETFSSMNLNVLEARNIKGTLRCAAAVHTDLDARFLPDLTATTGYVRADIRSLELLDVEALEDALKMVKKRTQHLYFEPVSSDFVLSQGQLLIPDLRLNSNLTELQLSGRYGFDGRANLYLGLNPMHALFGDNKKRIARIQAGDPVDRNEVRLSYINLHREQPHTKLQVRLFQKHEQRQQQAALRQLTRQVIATQRLDTTIRLPQRVLTVPAPVAGGEGVKR